MAEPTRVFVSYRREESSHIAGRLADRLNEHFRVFRDIDTIEPGTDFTQAIRRAVAEADVFVALIGPQWTELADSTGQRRLDDPNDWVATEIATALERGIPVIPVLLDGAPMPTPDELPEALGGLASRQAVTLRHESFTSDSSRLLGAIERRVPAARLEPESPEQLASWEAQADAAARDGRWVDAVELLERVKAADPTFGQVARKLPAALRLRRIAELTQEILEQARAGNWQAVLNLGSELGSLDPVDDDPYGLVTRARRSLAEGRRRQLASLFDQAVQAEAAGRLQEAADALQQINALDPQNVDVASRLQAVRLRMDSPTPGPGADQAAAARVGGPQPDPSGSGTAATAVGPPPSPPPSGPVTSDAKPQPQQEKRSRLPLVLAALLLVGIAVAVVLILNPGRDSGTTAPSVETNPSVPPAATPTPSTPATPETDLDKLRSHLPTHIRDTCAEYNVAEQALTPGLLAAVHCTPQGDGPDRAWYFLYESESVTKKAFAEFVTGTYESGDCTKKQQMMKTVTSEDGKKLPAGVLKCYVGQNNNHTTFAWTHEDLHILAFADDPEMTFPEMKTWWLDAGPFRKP